MDSPEVVLQQIIAFLGESWDPAMLSAEVPAREVPETLSGKDHAAVIREAGPALAAFGYTGTPTQAEEGASAEVEQDSANTAK